MILPVAGALMSMLVAMAAGWVLQRAAANGGWTDVVWTYGTGAACAAAALVPFGAAAAPDWRQLVVAALVGLWSLRLGTYVALRVARGPEDARYAALRRDWGEAFQGRMFGLMIVQAPASALLAASVLLAARNPAPSLRAADVAGALVLLGAIVVETIADAQMKRFKADPANHGRVCAYRRRPDFIQLYVFPGGMLPSEPRLKAAAERAGLAWTCASRFGQDYAQTLAAWSRRHLAHRDEVGKLGFDKRFDRLWRYYLAYCEAGFRTGRTDVIHVGLVRP